MTVYYITCFKIFFANICALEPDSKLKDLYKSSPGLVKALTSSNEGTLSHTASSSIQYLIVPTIINKL